MSFLDLAADWIKHMGRLKLSGVRFAHLRRRQLSSRDPDQECFCQLPLSVYLIINRAFCANKRSTETLCEKMRVEEDKEKVQHWSTFVLQPEFLRVKKKVLDILNKDWPHLQSFGEYLSPPKTHPAAEPQAVYWSSGVLLLSILLWLEAAKSPLIRSEHESTARPNRSHSTPWNLAITPLFGLWELFLFFLLGNSLLNLPTKIHIFIILVILFKGSSLDLQRPPDVWLSAEFRKRRGRPVLKKTSHTAATVCSVAL